MQPTLLLSCLCAAVLGLCVSPAFAHGGQYRGPEDVVPPNPGGAPPRGPSGPQTGQPGGPSSNPSGPAPAPGAGPITHGGSPQPRGSGPGPVTPRGGVTLDEDFSRWEYWWEFNKDRFLGLKDALYQPAVISGSLEYWLGPRRDVPGQDLLRPSDDLLRQRVLPALKRALDGTDDRDIASACMLAMAKARLEPEGFRLHEVLLPRLQSRDQEIRETAALALGIASLDRAEHVDALVALASDSAAGRRLSDRAEVHDRSRAFAAYALGLLARGTANPAVKQQALLTLRPLVLDAQPGSWDLRIAAIHGLGLLAPGSSPAEETIRREAVACLEEYYLRPLGVGEQILQAHCPIAIARLLGPDHQDAGRFRSLFADELRGRLAAERRNDHLAQSCAQALGELCRPFEDDGSADAAHSQLLLQTWREHRDAQTRAFALMALGHIGGAQNRTALLQAFERGNKALEKGWAALAIGVLGHTRLRTAKAAGRAMDPDRPAGDALLAALQQQKTPSAIGGIALGLGLLGHRDAAPHLRELLRRTQSQDELAGHIAVGLGLLGDAGAVEPLRDLTRQSVRRPDRLRQTAVALGRLGDRSVAEDLHRMLADGDLNLARLAAVASALALIGDRRSIEPLTVLLQDSNLTPLSRAFAAVALGGIADRLPLPWNAPIGANANYRAAVATLVGGGVGILDIL